MKKLFIFFMTLSACAYVPAYTLNTSTTLDGGQGKTVVLKTAAPSVHLSRLKQILEDVLTQNGFKVVDGPHADYALMYGIEHKAWQLFPCGEKPALIPSGQGATVIYTVRLTVQWFRGVISVMPQRT